jgi:hypothetical protein
VSFQVLCKHNPGVTPLRNFLKLRKERKLAEERGERSLTETLVFHEKSGHGRVIRSEDGAVKSDGNPRAAEQDDWRQVCLPPILCLYHSPAIACSVYREETFAVFQKTAD